MATMTAVFRETIPLMASLAGPTPPNDPLSAARHTANIGRCGRLAGVGPLPVLCVDESEGQPDADREAAADLEMRAKVWASSGKT